MKAVKLGEIYMDNIEKIIEAYNKKSYALINKAIDLKKFNLNFNFDSMFALNATRNFSHILKNEKVGQIIAVHTENVFYNYIEYINSNFKKIFSYNLGNLDFFYSVDGGKGIPHVDKEHVLILGVKNVTFYHLNNKDVAINEGDLLYIHKDIWHHVFSSRERIVLSLSFWEH